VPGENLHLYVTDGESHASVMGDICQAASNKPLDEESARKSLGKTGGTPFVLRELTLEGRGAFAPASALNALRREALEQLSAARIAAYPREKMDKSAFDVPKRRLPSSRIIVKTQQLAHVPALLEAGADEVLLQPRDYRKHALEEILKKFPEKARLCLPAQCKEDTLHIIRELTEKYHTPVCVSSPGQLSLFSNAMAGEGVPVMNGEAIRMLSHLGCESVTLSRELSRSEISELPLGIAEMILPVYGRARLMLLNHCPMRTQMGLEKGKEACRLCEQGKGAINTCLSDRMHADYPLFPLHLPEGCLVELYADKPLHLAMEAAAFAHLSWLLNFTDEELPLCREIASYYAAVMRGENPPLPPVKGGMGRYIEGVL